MISIDIQQRCDGTVNCVDKSDEIQCHKIRTDEAYLKDSPPAPIHPEIGKISNSVPNTKTELGI